MRHERGTEVDKDWLRQLTSAYTPNVPIVTPARFSGRRDALERCRRLLDRPGATLLLFGDRGVGKTSFCNVLLHGKHHKSWQASGGDPE
jgi:predicted GTPase